jgi:hypothetical protein
MALAQSPVLQRTSGKTPETMNAERTCFPTLVRPRASRRLCTGLVIQLIRGSRRIYTIIRPGKHNGRTKRQAYSFVVGVHKDDFEILVNAILVYPVRVQDSQVSTTSSNTFLGGTPETALGLQVVNTLTDRLAVGGT